MRLDGKVNKIERLVASYSGSGEVEEEKRMFHLTVRIPDKSLQGAYNYGYGNMNFITHGRQMEDFVDLGGQVDIYVVAKGETAEVPNHEFERMRGLIYELEGTVAALTKTNTALKDHIEQSDKNHRALHDRLRVAMEEVMRLEARQGQMPPAPALLTREGDEG